MPSEKSRSVPPGRTARKFLGSIIFNRLFSTRQVVITANWRMLCGLSVLLVLSYLYLMGRASY